MRRIYANKTEKNRAYKEKAKKKLDEIFGDCCVVCGSQRYLVMHNINFEKHPMSKDTRKRVKYYLEHSDEFVRLCKGHHTILHIFDRNPLLTILMPLKYLGE